MNGEYVTYNVLGETYKLLTIGDWKRVVSVSYCNNDHLNPDQVPNVKVSDAVINALLTNNHEYSIWCTVDQWVAPFNEWQPLPHNMYVHNSIERWDSSARSEDIPGSNLLSQSLDQMPVETNNSNDGSQTFGFAGGDIFYGYGDANKNGFTQHFSGAGRGAVYVR